MRLSLERRAHSSSKCARASRMKGGSFSKMWRSHLSEDFAANLKIACMDNVQEMMFWNDAGLSGRGAEIPGMAFWQNSGSSKRNSEVDSWR
eukprot:5859569-Pyramimonas_sp.AAC.1